MYGKVNYLDNYDVEITFDPDEIEEAKTYDEGMFYLTEGTLNNGDIAIASYDMCLDGWGRSVGVMLYSYYTDRKYFLDWNKDVYDCLMQGKTVTLKAYDIDDDDRESINYFLEIDNTEWAI